MYRVLSNHLLVAVLVLAAATATGGQEKQKSPDYYPLVKGNKWVYSQLRDGKEGGERRFDVWKIAVKGGKTTATVTSGSGIDPATSYIYSDEKGVSHEAIGGVVPLLKYPVKTGDKWSVTFKAIPPQAADYTLTATVVGVEAEVTVPAGKFKAVEVRTVELGGFSGKTERIKESIWYAAGVGIVKRVIIWENIATGTTEWELAYELKKFTPAK